jgi:uncharacterized protein YjbI with pentapeptide repeats
MAKDEHLAILKLGVDLWNTWRQNNRNVVPDLTGIEASGAKLNHANLGSVNLSSANLSGADLSDSKLNDADLRGVNLNAANLRSAILSGANVSRGHLIGTKLIRADLTGANLIAANLSDAILRGADLRGAHLLGANLTGSNLVGANLLSADLRDADLRRSNLRNANLGNANLRGADLDISNLRGADVSGARIGSTRFGNIDLSDVRALDSTFHFSPSNIDVASIYRSKGKIPASFLRGCGVPENLIRLIPSLVGAEDGIQFYSCFISYSFKDEEFARRLHARMRDAHLRVWFAPEEIQAGRKLHEQIETAIRVYDKLLIVLSEPSLQSEWVMTELRKARKAERQSGGRKLFPVRLVDFETLRNWECLDPETGNDLAIELREYFIPDFSNWKDHDQFEAAFSRLLKDLRAEDRASN